MRVCFETIRSRDWRKELLEASLRLLFMFFIILCTALGAYYTTFREFFRYSQFTTDVYGATKPRRKDFSVGEGEASGSLSTAIFRC